MRERVCERVCTCVVAVVAGGGGVVVVGGGVRALTINIFSRCR